MDCCLVCFVMAWVSGIEQRAVPLFSVSSNRLQTVNRSDSPKAEPLLTAQNIVGTCACPSIMFVLLFSLPAPPFSTLYLHVHGQRFVVFEDTRPPLCFCSFSGNSCLFSLHLPLPPYPLFVRLSLQDFPECWLSPDVSWLLSSTSVHGFVSCFSVFCLLSACLFVFGMHMCLCLHVCVCSLVHMWVWKPEIDNLLSPTITVHCISYIGRSFAEPWACLFC